MIVRPGRPKVTSVPVDIRAYRLPRTLGNPQTLDPGTMQQLLSGGHEQIDLAVAVPFVQPSHGDSILGENQVWVFRGEPVIVSQPQEIMPRPRLS